MIKENLKIITKKINEIAQKSNRDLSEIRLIAVSKTNPISAISEVLENGIFDFGENKALELRDKNKIISKNIIWHFIGHLQSNKVKYVIEPAEYIHSVENLKLLNEINKRAKAIGKKQKILFEINTSHEESKFGLKNYEALTELVERSEELENIIPVGLMTMASFTADENEIRKSFESLREMRDKISSKVNSVKELSMGMTNDYRIAIEEGATMIRIGTAIFGKRDISKSWSDK